MHRSTYSMEHYDYQRRKLNISRGLETVGDTRFGTIYWAAESVRRGLPAFRAIVADESLGISISVSTLFSV